MFVVRATMFASTTHYRPSIEGKYGRLMWVDDYNGVTPEEPFTITVAGEGDGRQTRIGEDTSYYRATATAEDLGEVYVANPPYAAYSNILGQGMPKIAFTLIAGPNSYSTNGPLTPGDCIAAYRQPHSPRPLSGSLCFMKVSRIPVRDGIVYAVTEADGSDTSTYTYILYGSGSTFVHTRHDSIRTADGYNYSLTDAKEAYNALLAAHAAVCLDVSNPSSSYYTLSPYRPTKFVEAVFRPSVPDLADRAARGLKRLQDIWDWGDLDRDVWGRLSADVINQYKTTDVDMIENMTQLSSFGDTLRAYIEPIDLTPKGLAMAASGRLLSAKYGDKLTIQDAASLQLSWYNRIMGTWTEGDQTRRASRTLHVDDISVRCNFEAIARRNQDGISKCFMFAADRGFLPSLSTVWNLVPYSFVVDWFLNVQELMAGADAQVQRNLLTCVKTFSSWKIVHTETIRKASIHYKIYSRSVGSEFPFPYADLHIEKPSLNQLVTGAALLVQRFK